MPAIHKIDDNEKIIITTWEGETKDAEFIDALTSYLKTIKSQECYLHYNELLDLRGLEIIKISADGIRQLAEISAGFDREDLSTRLAIVVGSSLAFGLSRMYQTYRSLISKRSKEVQIFNDIGEAQIWLTQEQPSLLS